MSNDTLTEKEKSLLFWASFLSLLAAGVGFVFRVMIPSIWETEFKITLGEVGALTGAALWPIAITMIIFSLLVDKIGYKLSMFFAFAFQAASVVLTVSATSVGGLWWACFFAGLGHGVVEAVINPLCASAYREEKSKWLNILHAAWPGGIVFGGIVYILMVGTDDGIVWADMKWVFWIMLAPVVAYGVLFLMCKRFPVDERVEAGVSYTDMLRDLGGLGIGLASTFLLYEIFGQLGIDFGGNKLWACMGIGAAIGFGAGFLLGSKGRVLFFVLCLIMIPLATAELATDAWIQSLMKPIMGTKLASWAIVLSAFIMMVLRFFAGVPLKYMNPPQLLLLSSIFSIVGLFALSVMGGKLLFLAFVLYAVGQTFYWPTVLGFVSEQFPKGGAMTLNTVSAMGLLTVGIFGFPFLGAVQDSYKAKAIMETEPIVAQAIIDNKTTFVDATDPENPVDKPIFEEKKLFGVGYNTIVDGEFKKLPEIDQERADILDGTLAATSQKSLRVAAVLPAIMAVSFILIILYYKSIGGYKPVVLNDTKG